MRQPPLAYMRVIVEHASVYHRLLATQPLSLSSWHALCGLGPESPLPAHVHAGADDLVHQQQLRRHDRRAVEHLRAADSVATGGAPWRTAHSNVRPQKDEVALHESASVTAVSVWIERLIQDSPRCRECLR
jgi:hypothetical protein